MNANAEKFPNRSERWTIRRWAFAVMLGVFWICLEGPWAWRPKPTWTKRQGGGPDEQWFRCVMFPRSPDVQTFDAPNGKPLGTLTRAVTNTPSEIWAGGWIGVNETNAPKSWVRFEDLTFELPNSDDERSYLSALQASLAGRFPQRTPTVRYEPSRDGDGFEARYRESDDKGWQESWYSIQGGHLIPEKQILVSAAGAGIAGAVDCGMGIFFALIAGAISGVMTRRYLRKRRSRSAAA